MVFIDALMDAIVAKERTHSSSAINLLEVLIDQILNLKSRVCGPFLNHICTKLTSDCIVGFGSWVSRI